MIDLYCERLGPEFWSEPVNALTNLAFIIAAIAAWRLAKFHRRLSLESWVLIGLMGAIGIGSFLFHTLATQWARVMDVVPILLYQLAYMAIYGRAIMRLGTGVLVAGVATYLVAALFARQFSYLLNGALIYAPAFLLVLGLGVYHYQHSTHQRSLLLIATAVFCLSLFFRTIDMAACPYFSLGTHFLWHLFNGLMVYLTFKALFTTPPAQKALRP